MTRQRPQPQHQLHLGVTALERLAVDEIRVKAALNSEADVLRLALQRLCDHYDLDGKLFAFRKRRDPRTVTAA